MQYHLSERIQTLAPSATLAVSARARALRDAGVDVVDFGAGEPDFDTPDFIKEAAITALRAGDTKYPTPVAGKNFLREAVRGYFERHCGLHYKLPQIHVSVGAKDALMQAFVALLNPGDEVIIPVPYWVSYPEQVRLAGGRPVLLPGARGGASKITAAALRAAITPRTRAFILNSPSNPSGVVYTRAELAEFADVLAVTDVIVISDELYHRLLLTPEPYVSFGALPGMAERTLTINGVSKTYAMTGWRLGFCGGPEPLIAAMTRLQGQTTSGAVSFVQTAAAVALNGDQACVAQMCAAYRARAEAMCAALRAMPGVRVTPPQGGFVMLADVSEVMARRGVATADDFAAQLLEKSHVAVVSGSAFGLEGHIRLSFATSDAQIERGMAQMRQFFA